MALTLNRKPAPGASTPVVLRPEAQGQWALAWRKFRRNTVAVLSLALIAVYLVAAALAATLAPHNPVQDRSGRDFLPPFWQMQSPAGQAYDAAHPLGTDQQGRDVLSRLLYGGRSSMVTGVLPVLGNLLANTLVFLISLAVSPWLAIASICYLILIHKTEYFINARTVGARVQVASWEILAAMLTGEALFGVQGLVAAPLLYPFFKREIGRLRGGRGGDDLI